jgi:hypothetical protein
MQPPRRTGGPGIVVVCASLIAALALSALVYGRMRPREVYLIPLEAEPELMLSLERYFEEQLNVRVTILPSVQLNGSTWDRTRRQLVAERVIDRLFETYPGEDWPRNVIPIGVTSHDMYIDDRPQWGWAFSLRDRGRAIVSYARMTIGFRGPAGPHLVDTRLRKMVARNIGFMGYGLEKSPDRTNLMYQDVLGIDELDQLELDLERAGFP